MHINGHLSKIFGFGFCCLELKRLTETVVDLIHRRKENHIDPKSFAIPLARFTVMQMVAAVNVQLNAQEKTAHK